MTDEESEALYEFSKAFLEDRKWTLERGFNAYTQDWLDHYMRLKGERTCHSTVASQSPD